jgi:hypothetical protein
VANGDYIYVFDPTVKLKPGQCFLDPTKPETWKPCDTSPSTQRIWWDVFPIPSGRTVTVSGAATLTVPSGGTVAVSGSRTVTVGGYFKMRTRFADFPGVFVLHCHILAHEDRGMMTIVSVAVPKRQLLCVSHH